MQKLPLFFIPTKSHLVIELVALRENILNRLVGGLPNHLKSAPNEEMAFLPCACRRSPINRNLLLAK